VSLGDEFTLAVTAGPGAPALEAAARNRAVALHVLDLRGRNLCDRLGHDLLLVRPTSTSPGQATRRSTLPPMQSR